MRQTIFYKYSFRLIDTLRTLKTAENFIKQIRISVAQLLSSNREVKPVKAGFS